MKANKIANRAIDTRARFLAVITHELRTPINGIVGLLELLERKNNNKEQNMFIDSIRKSAYILNSHVSDILDFSKIEAGKLELERVAFPLDKVLDHALDLNALKAQEKGVELLLYAPVTAGLILEGDPLRLGQVLINMLSNAVKFTQSGEIELGCEDVGERDHRITLKFWVRDTGIGISKEQQESLFDAFHTRHRNGSES